MFGFLALCLSLFSVRRLNFFLFIFFFFACVQLLISCKIPMILQFYNMLKKKPAIFL